MTLPFWHTKSSIFPSRVQALGRHGDATYVALGYRGGPTHGTWNPNGQRSRDNAKRSLGVAPDLLAPLPDDLPFVLKESPDVLTRVV